jgi:hypothetical protein
VRPSRGNRLTKVAALVSTALGAAWAVNGWAAHAAVAVEHFLAEIYTGRWAAESSEE